MAVTWKRNAGKIMCCGDSITVGYNALTGGWRKKLFADLVTANIGFQAVGPYTTDSPSMAATAHRGLSGDRASVAKTGIGAEVATASPDMIIWGFGMNDLGLGASSSTYLTDLDACIDAAQANAGFCRHIVQTLIRPTAAYAPYFANVAQYDAAQTALPARVATQGGTMVDVGAPTLSDGVHPADGASGFDAMATAIYTAVLAAIP